MATDASSLEDTIYECALLPENWPKVLDKLAGFAGARGGVLVTGTTQKLTGWTASASLDALLMGIFASGAVDTTRRLEVVLATGSACFVRDDRILAEGLADGEALYEEHLWPAGLGYAAGTAFRMPTGEVVIISLERDRAKGQVERGALSRLDALRPHIARSAYLAARQELKRAKDTVALLAKLGLPALVFSNAAQVLAANELAEGLTSTIIWRADNRVALNDRNADPLLQHAIGTIERDDAAAVRSFIVRGDEAQGAMVAHVLPIRGSARDLFASCAAVLILTPVIMPVGPPIELIQSLFDLTRSEASVARKIASGVTVEEIASRGGVTPHTVRSQLKGVLAKTGCRRQAEVAALLGNLAGSLPAVGATRSG